MKFLLRSKRILLNDDIQQRIRFCILRVRKHFSFPFLASIPLVLCLVVACNSGSSSVNTLDSQLQSSNCQVIEHAMGKSCVPLNPQRVITIDSFSLENVLALGTKPVGVTVSSDWLEDRDYVRNRLLDSDIEVLGDFYQPSLEKILAIKPDLILGLTEDEKIYPQLTQIAPTIFFDLKSSGQWKDILMHNANLLGKVDVANQIMADYNARLDDFKIQMSIGNKVSQENSFHQMTVSVIRVTDSGVVPYLSNVFCSNILRDAGLNLIPEPENYDGWLISKERLSELDADVIFVWSYGYLPATSQEAQSVSELIKIDPLWQQLEAVKEGHFYIVPSYWIGSSILSANAVIDDLFKYLVEGV